MTVKLVESKHLILHLDISPLKKVVQKESLLQSEKKSLLRDQ